MDSQIHNLAAHSTPKELHPIVTCESIDSLSDGKTPLYYATYFRNVRNVRYLVDNGADVNLSRPLHVAVLNEDTKCLSLLLKGRPSLDFEVEHLGVQTPIHHLISISKRGMINAVIGYMVKTEKMTTEIADMYLMRYVESNNLEVTITLLDLGIYRHRTDIPRISSIVIATALFVTYVKTLSSGIAIPYLNRSVKFSDSEGMEIMLAQYPQFALHIIVHLRDVLKSGKSYEFMLMFIALSDINTLRNCVISVISDIMHARQQEEYELGYDNVPFYGEEEEAKRIHERTITRLHDISRLERLLQSTCVYANVRYGGRKQIIIMGLPKLSDVALFRIRILRQRERLESLRCKIEHARHQSSWELIFE